MTEITGCYLRDYVIMVPPIYTPQRISKARRVRVADIARLRSEGWSQHRLPEDQEQKLIEGESDYECS